MAPARPFRFGATRGHHATARETWTAYARRVEALGYSTLVVGQHPGFDGVGPIAALATAAAATTTLRLSTQVLPVDLHHLAVLATEAATLDRLSGGRLELGVGAGWLRLDYEAAGLPFDPPGVRIGRLEEAVRLLKRLFRGETVTVAGAHYRATDLRLDPPPLQRPRPPILLGGGGRRMLSLAAREADIVGIDIITTAAGTVDAAATGSDVVAQRVAWVREAAGARFGELELHAEIHGVVVTDDRRRGAEQAAAAIAAYPASVVSNRHLSVEQVLDSPHFLIGTVDQIVEALQARRERYGVSYLCVVPDAVEAFAPVVARLTGT